MQHHSTIAILVTFMLPLSCLAAENVSAINPVHTYHLRNGLQLIVKEDHRAPVVISSIWYRVGSSYEYNGTTGVSHVLEHMMFQGTPSYGPTRFNQLIAAAGGDHNAMTTQDFTGYYQRLPAQALALSFKLESDRMQHLNLTQSAFKKEIQVVMEERRLRSDDDPQQIATERLNAAAFINGPYHNPIVGWMTDLKNMRVEDVRTWYHTWYHPNNAVLVVVGDVQPEKVYQLAWKYYGRIPAHGVPTLKPRTAVSCIGRTEIRLHIPAKVPYLLMGYSTSAMKSEVYALDVLSSILGGSDSAQLQNELVRQRSLATEITTDYNPFSLHPDLLRIAAIPAPGVSLASLEKNICEQIKKIQNQPITEATLNRIKTQMIAAKIYSRDSLQTQAFMLGIPSVVGLSWEWGENYVDAIQKVTPQAVRAVAIKYLRKNRLTVAMIV